MTLRRGRAPLWSNNRRKPSGRTTVTERQIKMKLRCPTGPEVKGEETPSRWNLKTGSHLLQTRSPRVLPLSREEGLQRKVAFQQEQQGSSHSLPPWCQPKHRSKKGAIGKGCLAASLLFAWCQLGVPLPTPPASPKPCSLLL